MSLAVKTSDPIGLTKYPIASLRELIVLSIPIILTLICTNLTNFCDRIFLSRYSISAFEGCVSASFLCLLFQVSCIRLVSIAQVFVGQQKGQGSCLSIGAYVWQMVWFSFFSLAITLPISFWIAPFYYAGTSIQDSGMLYFKGMMYANFLFPVGAAVSSFFIGLGKTKFIVFSMLMSQVMHLLLDFFLIFGIQGLFPPLGVRGAIIATIFSQAVFCLSLMLMFLKRSNRAEYGTGNYQFNWKLFWGSLKVGFPSALGKLSVLCAWAAIAKVMVTKGEAYLSVLTIGSSFALLFLFINDGIGRANTTIASYIIGAQKWNSLSSRLTQSTLKFLAIVSLILLIPFVLFPKMTLLFFFPALLSGPESQALIVSLLWLWVYAFTNGIGFLGVALTTAVQQTFFYMIICNLSWVTYLIIFYGMNHLHWPPERLWVIMATESLLVGITNVLWAKRAGRKKASIAQGA